MRLPYLLRHFHRERERFGHDAALQKMFEREIKLLIAQLRSRRELHRYSRAQAADLLKKVVSAPPVMSALAKFYRIRKRPRGLDLAMDYLIQKERLGKAASAYADVRLRWGVHEKDVKDAVTYWRKAAQLEVDALIHSLVSVTGMDRRNVLETHLAEPELRPRSEAGRKQ